MMYPAIVQARGSSEEETATLSAADFFCAIIAAYWTQVEMLCDHTNNIVCGLGEGRYELIKEDQNTQADERYSE